MKLSKAGVKEAGGVNIDAATKNVTKKRKCKGRCKRVEIEHLINYTERKKRFKVRRSRAKSVIRGDFLKPRRKFLIQV